MGKWAVTPYAFEPHKKRDVDGMSFFREDFVTPRQVAEACRHPDGALVARIKVRHLRKLGLTVQPTPNPDELPGHVIVPGLKHDQQRSASEKRRIADLSRQLAEMASNSIAYSPTNTE
jgi:hypothetical protein